MDWRRNLREEILNNLAEIGLHEALYRAVEIEDRPLINYILRKSNSGCSSPEVKVVAMAAATQNDQRMLTEAWRKCIFNPKFLFALAHSNRHQLLYEKLIKSSEFGVPPIVEALKVDSPSLIDDILIKSTGGDIRNALNYVAKKQDLSLLRSLLEIIDMSEVLPYLFFQERRDPGMRRSEYYPLVALERAYYYGWDEGEEYIENKYGGDIDRGMELTSESVAIDMIRSMEFNNLYGVKYLLHAYGTDLLPPPKILSRRFVLAAVDAMRNPEFVDIIINNNMLTIKDAILDELKNRGERRLYELLR